jgi:hypothetical protein
MGMIGQQGKCSFLSFYAFSAFSAFSVFFFDASGDLLKSLSSQIEALRKRLDEALGRQSDAVLQFEKQKAERQSLFNKFPHEDQLQFRGTFDMVQQQVRSGQCGDRYFLSRCCCFFFLVCWNKRFGICICK